MTKPSDITPTWKLANEMPKNSRICRPSKALAAITTKQLKDAIQIVRCFCARVNQWVWWMKNGTMASRFTTASRVTSGL